MTPVVQEMSVQDLTEAVRGRVDSPFPGGNC